jgi:hypothetical protein
VDAPSIRRPSSFLSRPVGIKYRRFTAAPSFDCTPASVERRTPAGPGLRRRRCMAIAPRRARGFCLACLQSLLPRRHPRGGLVDLAGGVDQIHQRPGFERRQGAGGARGEDRARGLGKIAGALDPRQIKHDRPLPQHRQQPPEAKAQRRPVARQRTVDLPAHQRLGRAFEYGLERKRRLVAGPLRPSPRPAAAARRARALRADRRCTASGIEVIHRGQPLLVRWCSAVRRLPAAKDRARFIRAGSHSSINSLDVNSCPVDCRIVSPAIAHLVGETAIIAVASFNQLAYLR